MEAKHLLFVEPLADGGGPLFESQRALALELVKIRGGGFEGKTPETVRIFVGQVLKPINEPGSRPLSKNLRRALPQAIATRIADAERAREQAALIIAAIELLKDPETHSQPLDDKQEWEPFIRAANDDDIHRIIIITTEPAETQSDEKKRANELTDVLIARVIDRDSGRFNEAASYDFFIPDKSIAENVRTALIDHLLQRDPTSGLDEAVRKVDEALEQERLNIYHVANSQFLANTCIFNPGSNAPQGFHLHYHAGNRVSVSVLNQKKLEYWFADFFRPIYIDRSERYELVPIRPTKAIHERRSLAHLKAA